MEKTINKRTDGKRFPVAEHCRGEGKNLRNGKRLLYRGVDVSTHGFGCILSEDITPGDILSLVIADERHLLQVMWSESYLGIEHQFRAGLVLIDGSVDLEAKLRVHGFVAPSANSIS